MLDRERLMNRTFPHVTQSYTARDVMLYALGVGAGLVPTDERDLPFVFEDGLRVLPSMAVVLAYPGFWLKEPDTGLDWVHVLHVGQELRVHRPLPVAARVEATIRVTQVIDKGVGKGALIVSERTVRDLDHDVDLATLIVTNYARRDGGFSGAVQPSLAPDPIPERSADAVCDLPTSPQAALVYRLSGDYNPLHAAPKVAREAGFERPILHGLCTFGVACRALLRVACDDDPARLRRMRVRFSSPVYPGETIRTEVWRTGATLAFRCRVVERDVVVINNGHAELSDAAAPKQWPSLPRCRAW
ncbi:MAG TPA: MaoC/PaaZ C-terminal domain-containing protein [Nevskiaceae bacterium]|nr:MaoC/PaaZ C-terminal domain-containing protein [Nevskiaceae bacterium]